MSLKYPYKRTIRPFEDGSYFEGGRIAYVKVPNFAQFPDQYIRPFLILQKDFIELQDFIEPSDENKVTYSYRIHELLIRVCVEIEANCRAILIENGYSTNVEKQNMSDYKKINKSHKLSSYRVKMPVWRGERRIRNPFSEWDGDQSLQWYEAYHAIKHNRHNEFVKASFGNLVDAICGLVILLTAQFGDVDFIPKESAILWCGLPEDLESTIGGYFRIQYPTDWEEDELYFFSPGKITEKDFLPISFDFNSN